VKRIFSVTGFVTFGAPWLEFHVGFRFGGNWLVGLRSCGHFRQGWRRVAAYRSGLVRNFGLRGRPQLDGARRRQTVLTARLCLTALLVILEENVNRPEGNLLAPFKYWWHAGRFVRRHEGEDGYGGVKNLGERIFSVTDFVTTGRPWVECADRVPLRG
jgi:hypothetical protein